jgi:hypothetical protein
VRPPHKDKGKRTVSLPYNRRKHISENSIIRYFDSWEKDPHAKAGQEIRSPGRYLKPRLVKTEAGLLNIRSRLSLMTVTIGKEELRRRGSGDYSLMEYSAV